MKRQQEKTSEKEKKGDMDGGGEGERTNNKKRLGYTYMRRSIRLQPLLVETGQPIFSLLFVAACLNFQVLILLIMQKSSD